MQRRKATDFPQEVLNLFDGYVHGRLTRRDFLDSAGKFAVGSFTAAAMLESLRPTLHGRSRSRRTMRAYALSMLITRHFRARARCAAILRARPDPAASCPALS
jgi:hypothetical protein